MNRLKTNITGLLLLFSVGFGYSQTVFNGSVKDAETNEPIPNARIFISEQGIGTSTNAGGRFLYRKPQFVISDKSELTLWANGYEPVTMNGDDIQKFNNKGVSFLLEKAKASKDTIDPSQKLTIFWDHSTNIISDKNEKEFLLLEELLASNTYKEISFIAFNQKVLWKETMLPNDEEALDNLIEKIENNSREGFSDASVLPTVNKGTVLLFATEKPLFGTLNIAPWVPLFQVTQATSANNSTFVGSLKNVTGGGVIPILKVTPQEALDYVQFKKSLPAFSSLLEREDVQLLGKVVTQEGAPISNVSIQIQGKLKEYTSNEKGLFKVPANSGDVLFFKALGKYPTSQEVESLKDTMVVSMAEKFTQLGEVIIKNKLSNPYGFDSIQSIERINDRNYAIRNFIYKKEFEESSTTNAIDFLERHYGFKTYFIPAIGQHVTVMRSTAATWIVDGKPGSPLDVGSTDNIERISIYDAEPTISNPIPSRIIVTTKIALHLRDQQGRDLDYKLTKNKFEEKVLSIHELKPEIDFTKTFKEIDPLDWGATYEALKINYYNQVPFYVNVSQFFQNSNPVLAEKVRNDLVILAKENTKALKIAAFLYDEIENYGISKKLYRHILKLEPNKVDNYRNLAIACANSKNEVESFYWFTGILRMIDPSKNPELGKSIADDFRNLLAHHKSKLPYQKLPNDWLSVGFDFDVKIVLEWNNPEASFKAQFVNPTKRYYQLDSPKKEDDKPLRFCFEIDKKDRGNWLVNIENNVTDDELSIPTYLKATIIKNYGLPNETKETSLIAINDLEKNTNIYDIIY